MRAAKSLDDIFTVLICLDEFGTSLTAAFLRCTFFIKGVRSWDDMIAHKKPDVIMVQEHWLTPARLRLFESRFADYFAFGGSAMSSCLESGMLRGRSYGGVMTLIKKSLRKVATTIYCEE